MENTYKADDDDDLYWLLASASEITMSTMQSTASLRPCSEALLCRAEALE
jgi:hypothetical protein